MNTQHSGWSSVEWPPTTPGGQPDTKAPSPLTTEFIISQPLELATEITRDR
jgi:hypothetical protein